MDGANGTSEAPFSAVEEPKWLNAETVTPFSEVLYDLGRRLEAEGHAASAELVFRAAELAKGTR